MNCNHTYLLSLLYKEVNSLTSGLCSRPHKDDNVFSILCTIVVKEVIFTTGNLGNLTQILLNDSRNAVIVLVRSLTMREESLWVFSCTTCYRTLRSECAITEALDKLRINERTNVFHIHFFYLMVFMRSTETIEEIDERNRCFKCCQVRNCRKIHYFLNRTRTEHSESCLSTGHYILVITEDTKRMRCQCTSRNVEYAWKQFTGNLVHIRNHQQQTL